MYNIQISHLFVFMKISVHFLHSCTNFHWPCNDIACRFVLNPETKIIRCSCVIWFIKRKRVTNFTLKLFYRSIHTFWFHQKRHFAYWKLYQIEKQIEITVKIGLLVYSAHILHADEAVRFLHHWRQYTIAKLGKLLGFSSR